MQFAFEVIGDPRAIIQAWYSTGVNGKLVIVGVVDQRETANFPLGLFMTLGLHQKSVVGSNYGGTRPSIDIPRLVDLAMRQDLRFDKLVTKRFKIEQINEVVEAMKRREVRGRWICAWD